MRTRTTAHVSRTGPDNKNENLPAPDQPAWAGRGSCSRPCTYGWPPAIAQSRSRLRRSSSR